MLKNTDQKTLRLLGIGLIVLGVVFALNLWSLLPVLVLGSVGAYVYTMRRKEARVVAAVQSGLWLMGLALLFLVDFVFPGILLLAGASLLLRGREPQVDQFVTGILARIGVRFPAISSAQPNQNASVVAGTPSSQQPPSYPTIPNTPEQSEPQTGQTTRL